MSTKDSDNNLVIAAFALLDAGNAAGYAYLFREAKKNPDMASFLNSPDTTMYADGHLGTLDAKAMKLPLLQFRNCVEHLVGSLRKGRGPVSIAFFPGAGGLAVLGWGI